MALPIMSMGIPSLKCRNFHLLIPHISPSKHLIHHCRRGIGLPYSLWSNGENRTATAEAPFWSRTRLGIWNAGAAFAVGEEIEAVPDTPESQFVSILLLAAFVGLALLTVGVIYLAVKDFQEKREREKLLKQEKAQEKKKRSKRVKSGPRGFGQKNRQR